MARPPEKLGRYVSPQAVLVRTVRKIVACRSAASSDSMPDRRLSGDREVRWQPLCWINLQHIAPLRKARTLCVSLGRALLEVINPLTPGLRVAERAKEIDFTTLGVAARAAVSEPVEKGATELSVGDTSAFEESGSAWVQDSDGGMSISWTGKTASALIGVSGLKRAFAAAATVTARDDLQRIKGVGPFIAEKLNMLGITTFRQVANMTPELEDQVNTAIEFFPGRVRRDKWAAQAAKMADE